MHKWTVWTSEVFLSLQKAKLCECQNKIMFVRSSVGERDVIRNVISCRCSRRLSLTQNRILLYRSVSLNLRARLFGRLLIERVLLCKAVSPDETNQDDRQKHCHNAAKTEEGCHLHFTALIFWSVTGRRCAQVVVVHFPRRPKKPQAVHLFCKNIRHVMESITDKGNV